MSESNDGYKGPGPNFYTGLVATEKQLQNEYDADEKSRLARKADAAELKVDTAELKERGYYQPLVELDKLVRKSKLLFSVVEYSDGSYNSHDGELLPDAVKRLRNLKKVESRDRDIVNTDAKLASREEIKVFEDEIDAYVRLLGKHPVLRGFLNFNLKAINHFPDTGHLLTDKNQDDLITFYEDQKAIYWRDES